MHVSVIEERVKYLLMLFEFAIWVSYYLWVGGYLGMNRVDISEILLFLLSSEDGAGISMG